MDAWVASIPWRQQTALLYMAKQKQIQDTENKPVTTSGEREGERGKIGVWDEETQTTVYKTDEQQRHTV